MYRLHAFGGSSPLVMVMYALMVHAMTGGLGGRGGAGGGSGGGLAHIICDASSVDARRGKMSCMGVPAGKPPRTAIRPVRVPAPPNTSM
eukprot:268331-Chlamydomonas_euryale.AAC.2